MTPKEIAQEILEEREKQKRKGWRAEQDDQHVRGELANAAAAYAAADTPYTWNGVALYPWPWKQRSKDRRHCLIVAAALIIAEIERLDRRKERNHGQ